MALKPTILKLRVALADSDRHCYESLSLTLAQHPSETLERLAVRLLAYCLNATPGLAFTRGLSTSDEPDLWQLSDSGEIEHWIDVGQPEEGRLRKACGRARRVSVYAFGRSADTWWKLNGDAISALPRLTVSQFDWAEVQPLAALLSRTELILPDHHEVANAAGAIAGSVMVEEELLIYGDASTSLEPRQLSAGE